MYGSTRRVSRTADMSVSSNALAHASSPRSSKRPGGGPPAFTKRMSIVPWAAWAVRTNVSQPSRVERSAATGSVVLLPVERAMSSAAFVIAASSRLHIATFAPSRATSSATARPSPFEAAATSATLPRRPRSMLAMLDGIAEEQGECDDRGEQQAVHDEPIERVRPYEADEERHRGESRDE